MSCGHGGNVKNGNGNTLVSGDMTEVTTQGGKGNTQEQEPPCTFELELSKEMASYNHPTKEGAYRPQQFSRAQLSKAASEFYKRWKESEEAFEEKQQRPETDKSPFVWVSPNCSHIPSDDLTHSALQHLGAAVDKLWYFLSDKGDLFIIKLASGSAHGAALAKVISRMGAYAEQYEQNGDAFDVISNGILSLSGGGGVAAPDGVLQLTYPAYLDPLRMRSPLVVEVEIGNRDPKALTELLDLYLRQPHCMHVLGIKIYTKQHSQAGWANPAVAILWRRANATNAAHPVVGVWNFGAVALQGTEVTAFCRQTGGLAPPVANDFQYYPPNNNTITIPDADLVQGAHYPNNAAPVPASGNDLTRSRCSIEKSSKVHVLGAGDRVHTCSSTSAGNPIGFRCPLYCFSTSLVHWVDGL